MLFSRLVLILFVVSTSQTVSSADVSFSSSAANTAQQRYKTSLGRVETKYCEEQMSALEKFQKSLTKEKATAIRKGNLKTAELIQTVLSKTEQAIESLKEKSPKTEPIYVGAPNLDGLSTRIFERAMARSDLLFRKGKVRLLPAYTRKLSSAKKLASKKGEAEEAKKNDDYLDQLKEEGEALRSAPPRGGKDFVISAKEGANSVRVSLGPLRKGRTLMIQYLTGKWTHYPKSIPGSPDDIKVLHENVGRLYVCVVVKGKVIPIIKVRGGTARRPLAFKPLKDIPELVLNSSDKSPTNNVGEVTYRVWIEY